MKKGWKISVVLMAIGVSAPVVRGEFIRNLGVGLAGAGFDVQGSRNILSGGFDLLVNNNFNNDVFRFGIGDIRLQGPISLDVSTGTRFVPTLDISFRTALDRDGNLAPLSYALTTDVGAQQSEIAGSLFIDGNVSLNAFGFYDVAFTYSSRQTVTNEGNISNDTQQYDWDLGPTVISGNVFADVLVTLTDPLFTQAGVANPFAALSGQAQLKQILENAAHDAQWLQETQHTPASEIIVGPMRGGLHGRVAAHTPSPDTISPTGVVPEPAVLLLMLTCIPVILLRRMAR